MLLSDDSPVPFLTGIGVYKPCNGSIIMVVRDGIWIGDGIFQTAVCPVRHSAFIAELFWCCGLHNMAGWNGYHWLPPRTV